MEYKTLTVFLLVNNGYFRGSFDPFLESLEVKNVLKVLTSDKLSGNCQVRMKGLFSLLLKSELIPSSKSFFPIKTQYWLNQWWKGVWSQNFSWHALVMGTIVL